MAQANLTRATLLAPASGTLVSLPWSVGDTASASDAITVRTTGSAQVVVDIGESSIGLVKVGQDATLTSATGTTAAGSVSQISLLPTSDTSATWAVTIQMDDPSAGMGVGTAATAVITVAEAQNAVLVPVSAVTLTSSTQGTVGTLAADGSLTTTRVTLGVRGDTLVQVTEGLAQGDTVVLADTSEAIPTNTTANRFTRNGSSLTGGSGGLPAGGAVPGR